MATIQHRRNIKQNWENVNPILAAGEFGVEVGVGGTPDRFKIGNGLSTWKQLKYFINEAELGINVGLASVNFIDRAASVPEIYSYFGNKETEYTAPTAFDSGHAMTFAGNATPVIAGGALVGLGSGPRAMYARTPNMGERITRVSARFRFVPGTGTRTGGGTVCIAICDDLIDVSSGVNVSMPCHFHSTRTNWYFTVWVEGTGQVGLAAGTYATPLLSDYVTEYEMHCWLTGTTATFELPDGTRRSVQDSRIESFGGNYAFFEGLQSNGDTDDMIAFTHIWADTGVPRIPPLPNSTGRLSKPVLDATYSPMKVKLKELWTPYSAELYPADDLISDEWVIEAGTLGTFFPSGYNSAIWNDTRINAQSQKLIPNNPAAFNEGARNNPTARAYGGGVIDISFKLHDDRLGFMTQFFKDIDSMVYVSDDNGRMRRLRPRPLIMTTNTSSYGFRLIKFKKRRTRTIRFVGAFATFYQILFSPNGIMSRPPDLPMTAIFGDSYRDALGAKNLSAGGVASAESYSTLAITDYGQMRTGWAAVRFALGGSGWFNNGSGTASNNPGPDNTVPFLSDANVAKFKAFGKNAFRLVEIYGSINDGELSGGKAAMKARVIEGLNKLYSWDPGIKVVLWGPEPFSMPPPGDMSAVGNIHDLNRQGMMEAAAEHPAVIGFIDQNNPATPFWYGTGSEASPISTSPQSSFIGMDGIHYNHDGGAHLADLGYTAMGELLIDRERLIVS